VLVELTKMERRYHAVLGVIRDSTAECWWLTVGCSGLSSGDARPPPWLRAEQRRLGDRRPYVPRRPRQTLRGPRNIDRFLRLLRRSDVRTHPQRDAHFGVARVNVVLTPLFIVIGWRFWRTEVRVSRDSILVRGPFRTRRLPADVVRSIDLGRARGGGEAVKEALVWHPYVQLADGSVLWMWAMEGVGRTSPPKSCSDR
jgi:hypothetical protein